MKKRSDEIPHPVLTEEEAERRIRRVAQLRNLLVESRRAAQAAWERGELPYPPPYDVRSDVEYWTRLREEKRRSEESTGSEGS